MQTKLSVKLILYSREKHCDCEKTDYGEKWGWGTVGKTQSSMQTILK